MKRTTAALAIVGAAIVTVTAGEIYGENAPKVSGDFRNAATAEVQDAQGQPMLRGSFEPVQDGDKGEVERLAKLAPVTPGSNATGEAEVEYQTDNPSKQEIELKATGVAAGTKVSLVIDGTTVASATADKDGTVELEVETKAASQ